MVKKYPIKLWILFSDTIRTRSKHFVSAEEHRKDFEKLFEKIKHLNKKQQKEIVQKEAELIVMIEYRRIMKK